MATAGQLVGIFAAAALASAGVAVSAETRSFQAVPGLVAVQAESITAGTSSPADCVVQVMRTGKPGVLNVTHQISNGVCVCNVTTGPSASNGSVEGSVTAILQNKSCPGATELGEVAAQTSGGSGGLIAGGLGVLAAGGGAAGAAGGASSAG